MSAIQKAGVLNVGQWASMTHGNIETDQVDQVKESYGSFVGDDFVHENKVRGATAISVTFIFRVPRKLSI